MTPSPKRKKKKKEKKRFRPDGMIGETGKRQEKSQEGKENKNDQREKHIKDLPQKKRRRLSNSQQHSQVFYFTGIDDFSDASTIGEKKKKKVKEPLEEQNRPWRKGLSGSCFPLVLYPSAASRFLFFSPLPTVGVQEMLLAPSVC
ncbi:hypothetical protein CISG_07930 [Coccidioides immitis RMSCC 3703]|uniref:Uncharacterized protein n=1 Tax=Coccidioides immitis RMSCC 3703 TaxID=454286 RepID=A0A0J8R7X7_COCIT|nr:hypothetical protein CISG_07930 [Coccidioides immitis RMSCC 3703]